MFRATVVTRKLDIFLRPYSNFVESTAGLMVEGFRCELMAVLRSKVWVLICDLDCFPLFSLGFEGMGPYV